MSSGKLGVSGSSHSNSEWPSFNQCLCCCSYLMVYCQDLCSYIFPPHDTRYQDLVEQHQMGSNPDYGIPTPTLVSPPKVKVVRWVVRSMAIRRLVFFLDQNCGLIGGVSNLVFQGTKYVGSTKHSGIAPSNLEIALLKQYPFDR